MLGIVLSENILLMLLFWELTSLSSFLLIGYWHHQTEARQGAVTALVVTGGGGLALLAGILLLGHQAGSYELSVILNAGYRIRSHSLYPLTLGLILMGAFTKSGQFPFHFWLPNAMAAPTPVSAYLHSATMVKAGIFLLARLFPALAGTDLWFYVVSGVGLTTLLLGAYLALFQHDLKGLLAYSTISHLGLITLLFGLGTPMGEFAGVFHIINHAIFKASLFMAAGIIDHEAGTRDMRRINGLFRYMPYTAALAMVASLAMAGVPLLNGFLSKEMFFGETLHLIWLGDIYWALPTAAVLAAMFSVAYSVRFVHDVFFNGEPVHLPKVPHEPPRSMKLPVEILVGLCLLVGILPNDTVAPLLTAAASSVLDNKFVLKYDLAIWHGLNLPFLMSLLAMAGGLVLYASRRRLFQWYDGSTLTLDGRRLFQRGLSSVEEFARSATALLTNGSLQSYLMWLILSTLTLGAFPFVLAGGPGGGALSLTGMRVLDVVGALGSRDLALTLAYFVVASVGTLLTSVALFSHQALSASLVYLMHSTVVTAACFLLADLIRHQRGTLGYEPAASVAQPRLLAVLYIAGAMAMACMPPLSGFMGKLMILEAVQENAAAAWIWAILLGTGLLGLVVLAQAGSALFWRTSGGIAQGVPARPAALVPVIALMGCSPLLVLWGSGWSSSPAPPRLNFFTLSFIWKASWAAPPPQAFRSLAGG